MNRSKWDERIRRAGELAAAHPFAADVLRFYEQISGFQKGLYSHIEAACGQQSEKRALGSLRDELDLFLLLPKFREFLSRVETIAPAPIAQAAAELSAQGAGRWQDLLTTYWAAPSDFHPDSVHTEALLAWIFLQPYAEYLADHTQHTAFVGTPHICPFCSGKPQVGVLRQEGDGAKRSLVCTLCSAEWGYRRLVCPSCGEENVEKLAFYTADQFSHVRVEACDTCRHYIKTVDLTKNGHAVPVVDELATIPLNMWAEEHGYVKLQPNLLGI